MNLSPATTLGPLRQRLASFAGQKPFLTLYLLLILSNAGGSAFSFIYNAQVILPLLNADQLRVFWNVAGPVYNVLAYPIAVTLMVRLVQPLIACRRRLLAGEAIPPQHLEKCRRRLVNLPALQVILNFGSWIPGAVFFPLVICWLG